MTEQAPDHAQIIALEGAYGPRWDAGDGAGWSRLYTEDGIFAVAQPDGAPEVRARGRADLAGRCDLFNRTYQGVHYLSLPELAVVDEHTARAVVPFTFRAVRRAGSGTLDVEGFYKVEYRRTGEGWRISHRHEVPTLRRTAEMHVRDVDGLGWLSEANPT